jgi:hypothetical protein
MFYRTYAAVTKNKPHRRGAATYPTLHRTKPYLLLSASRLPRLRGNGFAQRCTEATTLREAGLRPQGRAQITQRNKSLREFLRKSCSCKNRLV